MFCKIVTFLAHMALLFGFLLLAWMFYICAIREPVYPKHPARSYSDEAEFNRIRAKHFHPGQASIIVYEQGKEPYFMRDGVKCTFR